MEILTVQLNHPAVQKKYETGYENIQGSGFCRVENKIIREWNSEPHYRKFIKNKGTYIESIESKKTETDLLYFYGEWEGYSIFTPTGIDNPNGIHEPFHSIIGKGTQNTDPYVFGDYFKYSICFQTGVMKKLDENSLILFGTTTDRGFLLDTVFVVKSHQTASNVNRNHSTIYTKTYKEETLEQLHETYLGLNPSTTNRIYHSKTWWDSEDKDFFSYVPCKKDNDVNYDKVIIPIPPMAKQKVGHPYSHLSKYTPQKVWKYITDEVIKQGFLLGLKFDEPITKDDLACGHTPISGESCG